MAGGFRHGASPGPFADDARVGMSYHASVMSAFKEITAAVQ